MSSDTKRTTVAGLRGDVPFEEVALLASFPQEDKQSFVARAGTVLDEYTATTGFEGCGRIWTNEAGDRWGLALASNQSHIGCAIPDNPPFPGMVPTDETIHSHPSERSYRTNRSDRVFSGMKDPLNSRRAIVHEHFSPTDFKGGPGYLVVDGQLLYQDGKVEHLGELQPADANTIAQLPRRLEGRLRERLQQRELAAKAAQAQVLVAKKGM